MKIACLSGKGGAGKTFVAVNLAAVAAPCTYIDCDVEEPNGHLFFKPTGQTQETVYKTLPTFDQTKCTGCRRCVDFCRFHALVYIKERPMLFQEVCHSCGGCALVCPSHAVAETKHAIGTVDIGHHGAVTVVTGTLHPGEASGMGVIEAALSHSGTTTVLDCPPGSACSVMASIGDADYCVLVAEPTAFGFHNLQMVHQLATLFHKPCGVVINKETAPYAPLEGFCIAQNLPILARIPYDISLAQAINDGVIVAAKNPQPFLDIWAQIGGLTCTN